MILKRLLPPRWRQEKRPAKSEAEPQWLAEQATNDADPTVRRQACTRIADLPLLELISGKDADADVREAATDRLYLLLNGDEAGAPAQDERIACCRRLDNPALTVRLAREADLPELRQAALERLSDAAVLAQCAVQDAVAAVRLAAVERLQDKAALEEVARGIGKRDKKVYRLARSRLKEIAEREEAPIRLRAEAEALCDRLESLGRRGTWVQDKALLDHLERQWGELTGAPPEEIAQRFRSARETFLAGYGRYREQNLARLQEQETRDALRRERQELLRELEQLPPEDDPATAETRLAGLKARWEAIDPLAETDQAGLEREFHKLMGAAGERVAHLRILDERGVRLERLLERAETWLQQSSQLTQKELRGWRESGDRLAAVQPDDAPAQRFADLRERLQALMEKQAEHAHHKLERLDERLDLLERELEEGVLKKATSLHQSIHADLELIKASGTGRSRLDVLEQRYRHLTPRLREMQNWRKWGTDQHRNGLCTTMEGLITAELPLEALAEQVQALQAEWKGLDKGGSPVNESLWKRFHAAADQAYERCRPYLEAQAREREENRQAREALCDQLDAFLEQVDWARMDWKKAVRAEREMRQSWGLLGEVEPKQRRRLERRFHDAMKRLDHHLGEERARNKALKHDLIARAEALAERQDVEQAIHEIKQLQQQWHTTVASKRKQENHLWQQFRGACDQVFAKRRDQQEALHQELDAHLEARLAICAETETLARSAATGPEALLHELHRLQGRWDEGRDLEVPRREEGRLRERWQAATAAVKEAVRRLRREAERTELDRLRARAGLCRELERQVESGAPDAADTATWRQRWETLPPLEQQADEQAIGERFQAALAALDDATALQAWRGRFADNERQRRELCLHLEVLGGVESPPEAAQERLAFQVSRLSGHLGQGADTPLDAAPEVERAWYLCGPAAGDVMEGLERRFERVRTAVLEHGDKAAAPA